MHDLAGKVAKMATFMKKSSTIRYAAAALGSRCR
jgi:hypothetical protein